MDLAVKIFQIAFYLTASIIAVLTFIKAKNGLLNSVNTEYQKKVLDRLSLLSDSLWSEFDSLSDEHWSQANALDEVLEVVHKEARNNKHKLLAKEHDFTGVPVPKKLIKLEAFSKQLKSDPFVPEEIRGKLVEILDRRVSVMLGTYYKVISDYQQDLIDGKYWDTLDENQHWLHNKIEGIMRESGNGVSDLEKSAHELRLEIQRYYESFNPLKKKTRRKNP